MNFVGCIKPDGADFINVGVGHVVLVHWTAKDSTGNPKLTLILDNNTQREYNDAARINAWMDYLKANSKVISTQ